MPLDDDIFTALAKKSLGIKPAPQNDDVTPLLDRMQGGTFEQESGGNYQVRPNARTGAVGGFQVLPSNIPSWTKTYVGRAMTPQEFERDSAAQDKVFRGEMGRYLKRAKARGVDDDTAIRMAAAQWYGGEDDIDSYDNAKRFRPNEPSFREYTTSVLKRSTPKTENPFTALAKQAVTNPTQPAEQEDVFTSLAKSALTPQTPTSEKPVTEPLETIQAQIASAADPKVKTRYGVLTTDVSQDQVFGNTDGFAMFATPQGNLWVNVEKAKKQLKLKSPKEIGDFIAKNPNALTRILGIAENVGNATADKHAVTARDPQTDVELASAAVTTPDKVVEQTKSYAEQFPGATIETTTTDDVAKRREIPKGDEWKLPGVPRQPDRTQEQLQSDYQQWLKQTGSPNSQASVDEFNNINRTLNQQDRDWYEVDRIVNAAKAGRSIEDDYAVDREFDKWATERGLPKNQASADRFNTERKAKREAEFLAENPEIAELTKLGLSIDDAIKEYNIAQKASVEGANAQNKKDFDAVNADYQQRVNEYNSKLPKQRQQPVAQSATPTQPTTQTDGEYSFFYQTDDPQAEERERFVDAMVKELGISPAVANAHYDKYGWSQKDTLTQMQERKSARQLQTRKIPAYVKNQLLAQDADVKRREESVKATVAEQEKNIDTTLDEIDRDLEKFKLEGQARVNAGLLKQKDFDAQYDALKKSNELWKEDRGFLGIWNQKEWADVQRFLGGRPDTSNRPASESYQPSGLGQDIKSPKDYLNKAYDDMRRQYGDATQWVKAQKEYKARFEKSPLTFIAKGAEAGVGGVMKAPFQAASSALKAIAIASEGIDKAIGGDQREAKDRYSYILAKGIDDVAEGIKVDKDFKGSIPETFGKVAGQVLIQTGLGIATGGAAAPAILGGMGGMEQGYEEGTKEGLSGWTRLGKSLAAGLIEAPEYFIFRSMLKGGKALEQISAVQNLKATVERGLIAKGIAAPVAEKMAVATADGFVAQMIAKGGWRETLGKSIKAVGSKVAPALGEGVQEGTTRPLNDLAAFIMYDRSPERWDRATSLQGSDLVEGLAGVFGGAVGVTAAQMATRVEDLSPEQVTNAETFLAENKDAFPEETYNTVKQALENRKAYFAKDAQIQTEVQPQSPQVEQKSLVQDQPVEVQSEAVETKAPKVAVDAEVAETAVEPTKPVSPTREKAKKPMAELLPDEVETAQKLAKQDEVDKVSEMVGEVEHGKFKTGKPVTFEFLRNTEKSPRDVNNTFAQDQEPAGRYMIERDASIKDRHINTGWESGTITFEHPLVIDFGEGLYQDDTNWKQRLAKQYNATGKQLTKKLLAAGYDGIVTVRDGDTKEIIDLRVVGERKPQPAQPDEVETATPAEQTAGTETDLATKPQDVVTKGKPRVTLPTVPIEKARVVKFLNRAIEWDGVTTAQKLIDEGVFVSKIAEQGGTFDRKKFNRVADQEAYEKEVASKVTYGLVAANGDLLPVPKSVYDAIEFGEQETGVSDDDAVAAHKKERNRLMRRQQTANRAFASDPSDRNARALEQADAELAAFNKQNPALKDLPKPQPAPPETQGKEPIAVARAKWFKDLDNLLASDDPNYSDRSKAQDIMRRAVEHSDASEQDIADILDRAVQMHERIKKDEGASFFGSNLFYDIAKSPRASAETKARAQAVYDEMYPPLSEQSRAEIDRDQKARVIEQIEAENAQLLQDSNGKPKGATKQQIVNNERYLAQAKKEYTALAKRAAITARKAERADAARERVAERKAKVTPTVKAKQEATVEGAKAIAIPRSRVKKYAYADEVADQIATPEFQAMEAKSATERPSPRTGFTKTQTEYIAKTLEQYAKDYPSDAKYAGQGVTETEASRKASGFRFGERTEIIAPEMFAVPDDGVIRITDLQQANRLYKKLTGNVLDAKLPKESVKTPSDRTDYDRVMSRPSLQGKPNPKALAQLQAEEDTPLRSTPERYDDIVSDRGNDGDLGRNEDVRNTASSGKQVAEKGQADSVKGTVSNSADSRERTTARVSAGEKSGDSRPSVSRAADSRRDAGTDQTTRPSVSDEDVALRSTPDPVEVEVARQIAAVKEVRNADGKLLAPNGKVSNLNEFQWKQVRTPEFIAYFGDWLNDPENASKVVDENGEPQVYYHGTPTSDIEAFDKEKQNYGIHGTGIYFTDSSKAAERYGFDRYGDFDYEGKRFQKGIMPVYLNARRVFNANEIYTTDEIDAIVPQDAKIRQPNWASNGMMSNGRLDTPFNRILNYIENDLGGEIYGSELLDVTEVLKREVGLNNHFQQRAGAVDPRWKRDFNLDGIILNDAISPRGGVKHVRPSDDKRKALNNTVVIVAEPTQIKSAIGNKGTFDATDPSILRKVRNDKPFYSRVESVIADKLPPKATPAQVTALLAKNSVKELDPEFIALKLWLDDQGQSVSKADVLAFVEANKVEVEEVVKGSADDGWHGDEYIVDGERVANLVELDDGKWSFESDFFDGTEPYDSREEAKSAAIEATTGDPYSEHGGVKFAQWQLPGESENYREEFLTAPDVENPARDSYNVKLNALKTAIKDRLNIQQGSVADNTFNPLDYLDKGLLTEAEATQTRELYFGNVPLAGTNWKDGHSQFDDVVNPIARVRYNDRVTTDGDKMLFAEEIQQPSKENLAKMPKVYQKFGEEMAIRKMLYRAVEGGYDYFGFTTGEQQADRYNLAKYVSQIEYWKSDRSDLDGDRYGLYVYDKNNKLIFGTQIATVEELDANVGKELAKKIIEDAKPTSQTLKGLDLKVGGEGLINRYDRKHVDYINKLMKPYGVQVESKEINTIDPETGFDDGSEIETIHAVRISPEFRKAVEASMAGNGGAFPLFKLRNADDLADLEKLAQAKDFRPIMTALQTSVLEDANGANILSLDNNETSELFRTALAIYEDTNRDDVKVFDGLYLNKDQTQGMLDTLEGMRDAAQAKSVDTKALDAVIANFEEATRANGRVRLETFENARRHETIHQQSDIGSDGKSYKDRYANADEIANSPAFKKFHEALDKLQGKSTVGVALEEALAYLGDGDFARFGLTQDEAKSILKQLIIGYSEANGLESLSAFDHTELYEEIESFRKSQSSEVGNDTRSGVDTEREARPRPAGQETRRDADGKGEEARDAKKSGERLRSLPGTLREAGVDAVDEAYNVFGNQDAIEAANNLIADLGMEKAIKMLEASTTYDKTHAVMSFMLQRALRNEATVAEQNGDIAYAQELRDRGLSLASRHAELATQAGQFTQAAAMVADAVESVIYHAEKIAQKRGRPLTPIEYEQFEKLGIKVEDQSTDLTKLRKDIRNLKAQIKRLKDSKPHVVGTRVNRKAIAKAKASLPDMTALIQQIKDSLRDSDAVLRMVSAGNEQNFAKWFGDSKAIDAKGNPLRVYRGDVEAKDGIFFTSSTDTAEGYTRSTFFRGGKAPQTTAVYLSLQNPLVIDALGKRNDNIPVPWKEWKPKAFGNLPDTAVSVEDAYAYALENGHDGLIVKNVVDTADPTERAKPSDVYAVKEQSQIKSAIGNSGEYSKDNSDILRSTPDTARERLITYGAAMMLDKPLSEINREQFADDMRKTFGSKVEDMLPQLFAESFNLRQELLTKAKNELAIESLKAEFPDKSDAEIKAELKKRENERKERRDKGTLAKKLARLYEPTVSKQKQDVIDVVNDIADPVVADYAEKIITNEVRPVARADRKLYTDAMTAIRDAHKILRDEELVRKQTLVGSAKALRDLEREEFLKRDEKRTTEKALARAYRRLDENPLVFYGKELLKILGESRSILASGDLSGSLRQGFYSSVTNPLMNLRGSENLPSSYGTMIKAITNKESFADRMKAVENHPDFDIMKQMGIEFAEAGGGVAEENIRTEYLKAVPVVKNWLNLSERTYAGFLDVQRALWAESVINELRAENISFRDNPEVYKAAGSLINVATGRGNIGRGKLKSAIETFGGIFFAPRFVVSRAQLLGHVFGGMATLPPGLRKIEAKRAARFHTAISLPMLALIAAGIVAVDPDDDDFLKIRVGDKARYEVTGGLQQYIKLIAQLGMTVKNVIAGDQTLKAGTKTAVNKGYYFGVKKLAPVPSYINAALTGKEPDTTEFNWLAGIGKRLTPITVREVGGAAVEDGVVGAALTLPTLFGIGVGYYQDKMKKAGSVDAMLNGPEVKRMTTDDLVTLLKEDYETPADKKKVEMVLKKKALKARQAGTLTQKEVDNIKKVLPDFNITANDRKR